MGMAFDLAAIVAFTGMAAQALIALQAWLDPQAEYIHVSDRDFIALPGFQGAALQQGGVGEGRSREHDVLAMLQVVARFAIE